MANECSGEFSQNRRPLILLKASRKDGRLIAETSQQVIGQLVSNGHVVILKGAFEPRLMLEYRDAVRHWGRTNAPFPHGTSPDSVPDMNYHRVDDGVIRSAVPHIFHQFGFNNLEKLEADVGKPSLEIAESMRVFQNEVAGTNFPFSLSGLRLKVLHYPAGGGFLTQHSHPLEPQRIGLIASLSRIDEDVTTGATCFQTPFGPVDTTGVHDIGDIVVFRYDLPHEVTTIDKDKPLDWDSHAGKWSIVLELRETYRLSRQQHLG